MQLFRKSHLNKIAIYLDSEIDKIFTFLIAVASAYYVSTFIRIKASNPHDISNIANATNQWGPESNYIQVIVIILLSSVIFWLINWFRSRFEQKWFRIFVALFATSIIFFGSFIKTATTPALDSFHSGEQLAPSLAYNKGDSLFTDLFFLHGAGADVLIPNLSFSLFNSGEPSIGSYVLMGALLQAITTFIFFILVARFIRSPGFYLFTVFYFLSTIYSGFSYEKNLLLYVVLGLTWLILNKVLTGKGQVIALAVIGLLSSVSIQWSYDIGVMLILTSCLLILFFLCFTSAKGLEYKLRKPKFNLPALTPSLAIMAGGITGQLLSLLFLGINGYVSFVQTLFEITRYQGLMFDYPASPITSESFLFWLPVIIFSVTLLMFVTLAVSQYKERRTFTSELFLATILIFISLLYLRFGVGRPDVGHIAMASPILFLTGFYIIQVYTSYQFQQRAFRFWPVILILVLLFWPQPSIDPMKVFSADEISPGKIKEFLLLPQRADQDWITEEEQKVTKYILENSSKNDSLFALVPEPLYYYTTGLNNPSRFAISWFADPKPYTDELLRDLKRKPPKFIIYDSFKSPYRISDGVTITDRIPEVDDWVKATYTKKTIINDTVILSR